MMYYHVRKRCLVFHLTNWLRDNAYGLGSKDRDLATWLNIRTDSAKSELITELLK